MYVEHSHLNFSNVKALLKIHLKGPANLYSCQTELLAWQWIKLHTATFLYEIKNFYLKMTDKIKKYFYWCMMLLFFETNHNDSLLWGFWPFFQIPISGFVPIGNKVRKKWSSIKNKRKQKLLLLFIIINLFFTEFQWQ